MLVRVSLLVLSLFLGTFLIASEEGYLHLSRENRAEVPPCYRKAADPFKIDITSVYKLDDFELSREGLDLLSISGSGQFAELSFEAILEDLSEREIIIVDLRQESHLFLNGIAVSWKQGKEGGGYHYNKGKTLYEIEADEQERIENLLAQDLILLDPQDLALEVGIEKAETERALVSGKKLHYIRIPITDTERPSDETVEEIVQFFKKTPKDIWIHFHCAGGLGRTTTLMVMYDMLHNAGKLDPTTIILRHRALGGQDLFNTHEHVDDPEHHKREVGRERLKFLFNFYTYCQENQKNPLSWSEWNSNK